MNNCAILLSTCDKYEDAWLPFFTLFKTYWKECTFPIYLNTETKRCELHPNIHHFEWGVSSQFQWSERMRVALENIKEDYIVLLLEDFFLMSTVDIEQLNSCIDWMEQDSSVGMISFERNAVYDNNEPIYLNAFVEKKLGSFYRCTCQAALWRKSTLLSCLRDFESPWEFEKYGTVRSNLLKEKFYWQLKDSSPVFDYKWLVKDGYGICAGKWVKGGNERLFEKHGIVVDFNNLGYYEISEEKLRTTLSERILYYIANYRKLFDKVKYLVCNQKKIRYWKKEQKLAKSRLKLLGIDK